MASRTERFFPASGCVPAQGGVDIPMCRHLDIRCYIPAYLRREALVIKMNVTGEHTHYVSASHVHFYGE